MNGEDSWSFASAAGVEGTTGADDAAPVGQEIPALRPGQFGHYEILGALGSGGAGSVYRARDPNTGRVVALKVPRGTLGESRRERFAREGQLTAQLEHPGIVRIHSAGEIDGIPYLAYELVEGDCLDDAWDRLDRRTRLSIVVEVARAMGYAHRRGVVHRDLKPANVLLDEHDGPRVADFGLAMARGLSRMTQSHAMLGTPSHMAPEQFRSSRGDVGPPTDVWALGIMLYRALTDSAAFPADSLAELAGMILATSPRPPRSLDRSVSRAVQAVCLRALSRDPADRQPDAEVFAEELEKALAEPNDTSLPAWPFALAVGAIGAALGLLTFSLSQGDVPVSPAPVASSSSEASDVRVEPEGASKRPTALAEVDSGSAVSEGGRLEEREPDLQVLRDVLVQPSLTLSEMHDLEAASVKAGRDWYVLGRRLDPIRGQDRVSVGIERSVRLACACYLNANDSRAWGKLGEYLAKGEIGREEGQDRWQELAMMGIQLLVKSSRAGDLSARRLLGELYLVRESDVYLKRYPLMERDERRGAGWYYLGLEAGRRTESMREYGNDRFGVAFPESEDEAWEWVGGR